jgi:hypothetical protein
MATRRVLREAAFDPDAVAVLTAAFDHCVQRLHLRERDDPMTELLAKKIIECARSGELDPIQLCEKALRRIGRPEPSSASPVCAARG